MTIYAEELDRFPVEEKDTVRNLDSLEPDAVGDEVGARRDGNDQVVEVRGFGSPLVGIGDGNREGGCGGGSCGDRGGGDGERSGGAACSDRFGDVRNQFCAGVEEAQAQDLTGDVEACGVHGGGEGAVGAGGVEEGVGAEIGDAGKQGERQEVDGAKDAREPPLVLALDEAVGGGGDVSIWGGWIDVSDTDMNI